MQFPSAEHSPTNFKNTAGNSKLLRCRTSVILQNSWNHTSKLGLGVNAPSQVDQATQEPGRYMQKHTLRQEKGASAVKSPSQTLLEGINRQWKRIIRLNRQWNDVYHCASCFGRFQPRHFLGTSHLNHRTCLHILPQKQPFRCQVAEDRCWSSAFRRGPRGIPTYLGPEEMDEMLRDGFPACWKHMIPLAPK